MKNRISLMCSAMAMAGVAAFGTGCGSEAEVDDDDAELTDNDVVEGEGDESLAEAESAARWGSYGVFYDGPRYGGRWMMLRYPRNIYSFRNFRDGYWDGRISSFRIHNGGRFRLYDGYGYNGYFRDFDYDSPYLRDWRFDNRARALRWY